CLDHLQASENLSLPQPDGRLRIGVVWSGNPEQQNDHNRSMGIEPLEVLFDSGLSLHVISLQYGSTVEALAPQSESLKALDETWIKQVRDYADTASLLRQMDRVITVDTSVAHLAGALGIECWVLLTYIPDWRYGLEGEVTPWYPTMRLFRQASPGDWAGVMQRVVAALGVDQGKTS
ncbi:MAG: hypothetical protein HQL53_09825, partial [Magnetococcales bacterium]|nr:hypothetical protein [Magnetococcales bacterium]